VTRTKKARGHGFSMESSKDGKMALLERFYASGNSGAGKTVLTSSAVEEIRSLVSNDWTIGFAYFYCSSNDAASQEPVNILGSLQ